MSKKERTVETLKDILVGVLLVALVCLSVVYMLSYQGSGSYDFTRDQMDAISGETVKYQYLGYYDPSYCLPEVIAISYADRGRYALCTDEALTTANESLTRFYEKLFTEEGEMEMLTAEEGAAAFAEAMRGNYIYASYFCDLPKTVICSMADLETDGMSGEYIREVFIVPEEFLGARDIRGPLNILSLGSACYTFSAIARDSAGNYYRYTTDYVPVESTDISFNQNFCFAYSTLDGIASFDFAALLSTDESLSKMGFSEKVTDTTVIWRGGTSLPLHQYDVSVEGYDRGVAHEYLEALFINPEKASEYTDENGTRFYFDGGRNVVITADGVLTYSAPDEDGISMETLFGARLSEREIDVYDYLGAAIIMANTLEEVKNGGDEARYKLFLSSIDYDGELLRVSFGYRADGLPVYMNGTANILTVEFYRNHIRSVTYHLRAFRMAESSLSVPHMLWTLRSAITVSEEAHRYAYAYVVSENRVDVHVVGRRTK